ncbi:hypothetical protein GobsT_13210 [Gemmata obscuriglobus]|nr:hypothetical protein GobsT_13210 [Gemmata obscuriglobus]VTS02026.1 unnamed protein product [Gemmata obscuriglobus UQM 2246]
MQARPGRGVRSVRRSRRLVVFRRSAEVIAAATVLGLVMGAAATGAGGSSATARACRGHHRAPGSTGGSGPAPPTQYTHPSFRIRYFPSGLRTISVAPE